MYDENHIQNNPDLFIWLNNYEKERQLNYSFWTETQVDEIPELLKVLKKIK